MWRDGKQRVMPVRRPVARAAAVVDQENQQSEMGDYPTAQTTTTTHFLVSVLAKPPPSLSSGLTASCCLFGVELWMNLLMKIWSEYMWWRVYACVCVLSEDVCADVFICWWRCVQDIRLKVRDSVCVWSMCVCVCIYAWAYVCKCVRKHTWKYRDYRHVTITYSV